MYFLFNDQCPNTPFLNQSPPIFGLTPFGWLHSIMLTPTYCIISNANTIFDLHPLF